MVMETENCFCLDIIDIYTFRMQKLLEAIIMHKCWLAIYGLLNERE